MATTFPMPSPATMTTTTPHPHAMTSLPHVDFNFEDLRQRMTAFTARFDTFIENGRKRVLEERNAFRGRMGELGEDQKSAQLRITSLSSTLSTHSSLLSREASEKAEMQSQIISLERTAAANAANRDRLRSSIATSQRQIDGKLAAQKTYAAKMESQARLNGPELLFWETYLGCRVEGAGEEDLIRVIFTFEGGKQPQQQQQQQQQKQQKHRGMGVGVGKQIKNHHEEEEEEGGEEGADEEREAVFELRMRERGGDDVVYTRPKLDAKKVALVVDRLNGVGFSKGWAEFLKGMRRLFGEILI